MRRERFGHRQRGGLVEDEPEELAATDGAGHKHSGAVERVGQAGHGHQHQGLGRLGRTGRCSPARQEDDAGGERAKTA